MRRIVMYASVALPVAAVLYFVIRKANLVLLSWVLLPLSIVGAALPVSILAVWRCTGRIKVDEEEAKELVKTMDRRLSGFSAFVTNNVATQGITSKDVMDLMVLFYLRSDPQKLRSYVKEKADVGRMLTVLGLPIKQGKSKNVTELVSHVIMTDQLNLLNK